MLNIGPVQAPEPVRGSRYSPTSADRAPNVQSATAEQGASRAVGQNPHLSAISEALTGPGFQPNHKAIADALVLGGLVR